MNTSEKDFEKDLDMEPYFRAWQAQNKALENMPVPEVDLKKLKKWHRRSPRSKLLRREVAALLLSIAMLVFFLCQYKKGMAMPVPYIMTLLLCVLCIADSLYALRLIALTNPLTASFPDMMTNCARLRLYQKIELIAALGVVTPLGFLFMVPNILWIRQSVNLYTEWNCYKDLYGKPLLIVIALDIICILWVYRSNLHVIKGTIKEIRENRKFFNN